MKLVDEQEVLNYLKSYLAEGQNKVYISHIIKDDDNKVIKTRTKLYKLGDQLDFPFFLGTLEDDTYSRITRMELDMPNAPQDPYPQWHIYGEPRSVGLSEMYMYLDSK